tara:strand:- start:144684 stop:145019 length:336 start_codon:yes stop_codon:yes gene_type:complete
MTTRWEKGDEHIKLIVEGESTNVNVFKSALEIDLNGNILIDLSTMPSVDSDSIEFLNEFGAKHKAKHYSIIIATTYAIDGIKIEVVPSVTEARDMIFMEITERELGFFDEE